MVIIIERKYAGAPNKGKGGIGFGDAKFSKTAPTNLFISAGDLF
jgi:hypothetical protein